MYCIYREAFEASLRISKGNRCVVPSGVALWGRRCQMKCILQYTFRRAHTKQNSLRLF